MGLRNPRIVPAGSPQRGRVWLRRSAKILLSVLLFLTLAEVGLRATLFTDNVRLRKVAARLRSPSNFAHGASPEYWKLQRLFATGRRREPRYDPIVGWMQPRIESGTYDHTEHDRESGARPVLLYGDSYAQCVTGPDDCWEGILARSEFAETHHLLNYGTGSHGFDQAYLLLRESLGNYADENPLVIVSVLVDDDLDRSILPFRSWPKPLLTMAEDGSLVWDGPVHEGTLDYLDQNPPAIFSYLWRYLVHGTQLLPRDLRQRWIAKGETFKQTRRLNRRILEEVERTLDASGVEYFVLIFHGKGFFREEPHDTWREAFLLGELDRLQMPYVSSRTVIEEDMRATGRKMPDYFILKGDGKGHYNPEANEIVFEAIRRGLRREYESTSNPDPIDRPFARTLPGPGAFARFGTKPIRPFTAPEDVPRWVLGTGGGDPTELRYRLFGAVQSFSALLKVVPASVHENEGPVELSLWKDGEQVFAHTLKGAARSVPIQVDLGHAHDFRIRVTGGEAGVLLLASPTFSGS